MSTTGTYPYSCTLSTGNGGRRSLPCDVDWGVSAQERIDSRQCLERVIQHSRWHEASWLAERAVREDLMHNLHGAQMTVTEPRPCYLVIYLT